MTIELADPPGLQFQTCPGFHVGPFLCWEDRHAYAGGFAIALTAITFTGGVARAGGLHRHGPPCPDVKYWHLSPKAYAQWSEFGLFRGSWYERHKVVRRQRGLVVVREWRPFPPWRCA